MSANPLIERWFSLLDPARLAKGLWWNEALSLVSGCKPVSPACLHCWSAAECHMRGAQANEKMQARYGGLTDSKGRWTGEVRFMVKDFQKPYTRKKPTVYAVWTDLYHPGITNYQLASAYLGFQECKQHVFVVLTKRPERMAQHRAIITEPLPNVVHGTTVESQEYIDRVGHLVNTPSAARLVSIEPCLGAVDLSPVLDRQAYELRRGAGSAPLNVPTLDLVILGGESGIMVKGIRPMPVDAPRIARDQCAAAGVRYFFKQHGEYRELQEALRIPELAHFAETTKAIVTVDGIDYVRVGKKAAGRLLDGRVHDGGEE